MKEGFSVGRLALFGSVALVFAAVVVVFLTLPARLQGAPAANPELAEQIQGAPAATPHVEQTFPEPDIPELTEDERSKAISIATSHPVVAHILADRKYSIASVGVWHTSIGLQKVGAGVILSLAQPATLELDWPTIDYDSTEVTTPPYQQRTEHYLTNGVKRLVVMVNLQRGEVVAVEPGPEASTPPRRAFDAPLPIMFSQSGAFSD